MEPRHAPAPLIDLAGRWDDLPPWDRAELGRALRRLGWTYGEIMNLIPVPKGTLAGWCAGIRLTTAQIEAIKARTRSGVPRDTQRKRRRQIALIRARASAEVPDLVADPLWVAGTTMYWAEGSKTRRRLALTNTDPAALRLFVAWVERHLVSDPKFVLALHLHEGNDEAAAKRHWATELALADPDFHKTWFKPVGSTHRKNRHHHGVCKVIVRRSANALERAMAWIDALPTHLK